MDLDLLAALNRQRASREAAVLVTALPSGDQRLVPPSAFPADPLGPVLVDRLRLGRSGLVEHEGASYFLTVQEPPVRLVAIGAVHITQALAGLAPVAGLDLLVIDPRTAFAAPERFPGVSLHPHWPDEALPRIGLDRFTAVAALTHDPKIDDPALVAALKSPSFYVGALGSRKSHAARCERLRAAGFGDEDIARIHAPIGLDIGAVSPAEIAVSIIAEVIAGLRRKPARTEKGGLSQ